MAQKKKLKLKVNKISLILERAMESISLKRIHHTGQIMGTKEAIGSMLFMTLLWSGAVQSASIGIVDVNGKGEWKLYSPLQLSSSEQLIVQFPGKAGRADCCVKGILSGRAKDQEDVSISDEVGGAEVLTYKLKAPMTAKATRPFVGIAVIGNVSEVHSVGGIVHVTDGGKELVFNSCLGTEGFHVLARDQKKLTGHLYIGLGYSVGPTCSDEMLE